MPSNIKLSAIIALRSVPNFGSENTKPPEWLLDKLADERIEGPYKDRQQPVCERCFMRKARNGGCNCS